METKKTISEKLINIQTRLKSGKTEFNNFGKYTYRKLENILEDLKPLLLEEGLFLLLTDEVVMMGDRFYIKATASISDGVDKLETSSFARESLDKKGMDTSQITGSCSTYARKYALAGLLLLDDRDDADAEKPVNEPKKKQTSPGRQVEPKEWEQEQESDEEVVASDKLIKIILDNCSPELLQQYKDYFKVTNWDYLSLDSAYKILSNMKKKGLYNE